MSSDFSNPDSNNGSERPTNDVVDAVLADSTGPFAEPMTGSATTNENLLANVAADELSFLHPSSLIFDLLAHGKTYLVPAAFGLWGAAKGDMTLLIISALIFIPAFLFSIFRYFTFRYCIVDEQLIVREGLIFRNIRTVPISRIQNIDFVQNPLHRILRVAEVKVETASGTKPEATLRVLSIAKMESLRSSVFGGSANNLSTTMNSGITTSAGRTANGGMTASAGLAAEPNPMEIGAGLAGTRTGAENRMGESHEISNLSTILEIPSSWLVKAGLASNRGMIMIGVLIGAYFQFSDRRTFFSLESIRNLMPENVSTAFIVGASIVGLIIVLILLRLLGVGWFVLRFHGYKLVRRGDDLRISCGLLTKVSATVPRQRVQFISIHRNLVMRMFGLASIRIETAGGAGKEGENATESVSKRWFVPVIPETKVAELLAALRPGLCWDESTFDFKPLAEKAGRRLCRLAFVQAVLLSGIGMLITRPWGWLIGVGLLPFLLFWAIKKSKAMRYARTENGVVYRSGVFIHKTSATFFEKIQTLRVDQSPFDRRWKMASLSVDTAAAGPADHRIQVPYLDEDFAKEELQLLRQKTGQEQPVFG